MPFNNYNSLYGSNDSGASKVASTAARIGLGIATGGTSEIISNVLNIVPDIFQSILGGKQLRDASRIEAANPRPVAEIAPSVNKLVNYSYGQTLNQDIPGGEMYRGAAGIRAASELGSGSEAYGMLGNLVGREQGALSDLAKQTAQDVAGYKKDYMDALGVKAGEENRVWEWNKAQPYLQAAQVASQLRDSGTKNLHSGISSVFGAGAEWASPDFNSSLLMDRGKGGKSGNISLDELNKIIQTIKG